jgi:hypothetical protein
MALPQNKLSQVTVRYNWRSEQPDPTGLIDYDMGGIALNNNSVGLEYQLWTFTAVDNAVYAQADNTPAPIHLVNAGGPIEDLSCTFDQNMNPMVAYLQGGQWSYWWFDPVVQGMIISQLPPNVTSCRVALDERRLWESPLSDILIFYTRDGNLYHRRQRDRYQNDLLLRESVHGTLVRADMNGINRMQLKLKAERL